MRGEQIADRPHAGDRTLVEAAGRERALHFAAIGFPGGVADFVVYAAIGNDFDPPVGRQQIDQHAAVVFRIPYTQLAEWLDGPAARIDDGGNARRTDQ